MLASDDEDDAPSSNMPWQHAGSFPRGGLSPHASADMPSMGNMADVHTGGGAGGGGDLGNMNASLATLLSQVLALLDIKTIRKRSKVLGPRMLGLQSLLLSTETS